jgi:hypothetical protein
MNVLTLSSLICSCVIHPTHFLIFCCESFSESQHMVVIISYIEKRAALVVQHILAVLTCLGARTK